MGARSLAPRGTSLEDRGPGASANAGGMGGSSKGGSRSFAPRGMSFELRRNRFLGDVFIEIGGAVLGVVGVGRAAGVGGTELVGLPFILESHLRVVGEIAMRASESFCDMLRKRLCGADLRIGEAADVVELSNGSELRNECEPDEAGVRRGKGDKGDETRNEEVLDTVRDCGAGAAVAVAGRQEISEAEDEVLAAELSARDEDESVMRRELESCAGEGFLKDGRLKLVAGEMDWLLKEFAMSERRDAWSANRLLATVGSASEAERTVFSLTGEVFWSSIIFGRPAET